MAFFAAATIVGGSGANFSGGPNPCPAVIAYVRNGRSVGAADELVGTIA